MNRRPSPGPIGGKLIRKLIQRLDREGVSRPLSSHILLAVSAGSDSLALAQLVLKYGAQIAPKASFSLLHFDHGWRPEAAIKDRELLQEFALRHGVEIEIVSLKAPLEGVEGESWEDWSRRQRLLVYREKAAKEQLVWTAHHQDDLAETVLWRVLTGAGETHGRGIEFCFENQMRPLLDIRKSELEAFLREEEQVWNEDVTNLDPRFLRARLRPMMKGLEELFPRMVENLSAFAKESDQKSKVPDYLVEILQLSGTRLRRDQVERAGEMVRSGSGEKKVIELPEGWRFVRVEKDRYELRRK